jgi:tRNA A37 methylthiotransferase MiaB
MNKRKIFIYGILTCNRRKLDAQRIQMYFLKNNYEIVSNPKDSDIIILSCCSYSNKNANDSFALTKKFLDYNAELIVTGCFPETDKEELKKIFNGETISTSSLNKIDEIFPENKVKFSDIEDANIPLENINEHVLLSKLKRNFGKSKSMEKIFHSISGSILNNLIKDDSVDCHKTIVNYGYYKYFKEHIQPNLTVHKDSYFIRPSWGCLGNCSYCAIKNAIGPLESKSFDKIIFEFNKGLNQGYKSFIFDADDLGAYGKDIGSNSAEMFDKITDIPGDYMIHLRYIQPIWIVKYINEFEKVFRKGKIASLGSALQSGNSRILKLMHRFSDIEKIKDSFSKIKNAYPDLFIATEFINGFPTETFEELKDSLNIIKEIGFDWGYIIPFSCRPGTKAEKIEPKIPKEETLNRMKFVKEYLKKLGYNSSKIKNYNILTFSKISSNLIFDKDTKSFCFSTIE